MKKRIIRRIIKGDVKYIIQTQNNFGIWMTAYQLTEESFEENKWNWGCEFGEPMMYDILNEAFEEAQKIGNNPLPIELVNMEHIILEFQ